MKSMAQMFPRKYFWIAVIGAATCLLAWVTLKPAMIAFHHDSMESYWHTIQISMEGDDVDVANTVEKYEYHRNRLVDLGYFVYKQFDFPDEDQGEIHKEVWNAVLEAFPDHSHVDIDWPSNTLRVWCRPDEAAKWEIFVRDLQPVVTGSRGGGAHSIPQAKKRGRECSVENLGSDVWIRKGVGSLIIHPARP